nr:unnamed protein product [Callosobruchus analis]
MINPETHMQENENDGEITLEVEPEIKSSNDALDTIDKLNIFPRDEYSAYRQLKNSENHYQKCV